MNDNDIVIVDEQGNEIPTEAEFTFNANSGGGDGNEEENHSALIRAEDALPEQLYLIPVQNRPFFPAQVQPVVIDEKPWAETIKRVGKTEHKTLGLIFVDQGIRERQRLTQDSLPLIGCVVRIHNLVRDEGKIQFIAQGLRRFSVEKLLKPKPPYLCQVSYPPEPDEDNDETKAYAIALINTIKELLPLNPLYSEELKFYLNRFSPTEASPLADFAAAMTTAAGEELQDVLETLPLLRRMERVLLLLKKELEVAKLQSQIAEEVNNKMDKQQREFFLREQLKVIQKELGIAKDDRSSDIDEFTERLAKLKPTAEAQKRFDEEIQKLAMLETGSPEYAVTRNYLDWLTKVPWGQSSEDHLDLTRARKALDKHHAGLGDVKERILEFLAEGVYRGEISGSILLLVGPPGVGKTSIGKSVAESLGRKFYRFSLGGMRDEAEIKGHRRTYIGAMPGKLLQALKDVDVDNPVIMLDEIDKIGASYQGDPASALLEVLDPEQNREFLDHYLDLRVDLSKVLFICTANQLDTIPGPLLDRMDQIRLSGYITKEKVEIAKKHLWPRQLKRVGVKASQLKLSEPALKQIIEGYARESGVRGLDKLLHKIVRKSVVRLLEEPELKISVGLKQIKELLGEPVFRDDARSEGVGVVTGLAWTSMGGATLPVEAGHVHSWSRGFKLTGQLGDVMKESAEIAYSYVAANAKKLKLDSELFEKGFVHLHVPEGATPKDGPSAGVTMATALISLARGEKLNRPLAMTGELTLTGQVLAVGGIREKVIAARRSNIFEVILPEACRGDYLELPEHIKEGMTVHFARKFSDVAKVVFG